MLSALLFYYLEKTLLKQMLKKKIRVARKRAVEEYVNKKIQLVSDKKKELQGNLDIFDGIDVEQAMLDIINNLQNYWTSII